MQQEEFQYYLQRLEEENSFFALIEAGAEILPLLEAQFSIESSPQRRRIITRIIWEYRAPSSLAFLASVLYDPDESVWQEALNGIITIGGEAAVAVLRAELPTSSLYKNEYIVEALGLLNG